MKARSVAIAALAALLLSSIAEAGDGSGRVTRLTTYNNVVIFTVTEHANTAQCAPGGAFVFDASTVGGKIMYANLLAAVAADKAVSIYGSNSCPQYWADSELPNSISILP